VRPVAEGRLKSNLKAVLLRVGSFEQSSLKPFVSLFPQVNKVRVRRALHHLVFPFVLRSFFSFLSASTPTIHSKECHICGQHAATPQHERQTSVSRELYLPSGKSMRKPSTSPIQCRKSLSKMSKSLSDSLHSVLLAAGGTSREDSSSAIGPMP
jgi:hypothetical protein